MTRSMLILMAMMLRFRLSHSALFSDNSVVWAAHELHMVFTNDTEAWLESHKAPAITQVSINAALSPMVFGLGHDSNAGYIVTTDPENNIMLVIDNESQQTTALHVGTSRDIGQIAVDWTAGNVYWTDGGFRWLGMKSLPADITTVNSLDPGFKVVVYKHLDKPMGVAVHPDAYFLFWTDIGTQPKIERSNLIGGDRTLLVWKSLYRPTSLCVDIGNSRLFWTDPDRRTIEFTDLNGNNRGILASDPDFHFFGISIFRNNLFFTAPNVNLTGIYRLDQDNFGDLRSSVIRVQIPLYDIEVYSTENQPKNTLEACDSSLLFKCEHICVHRRQDGGRSCVCEDGYSLQLDETCKKNSQILERSLLYTNSTSICAVSVLTINIGEALNDVNCDVISGNDVITKFTVDMGKEVIYFTNGTDIYSQTPFNQASKSVLYKSSIDGSILDLELDWVSLDLFWTETGSTKIHYIPLAGDTPDVKTTQEMNVGDLRHLAVDPFRRSLYLTAIGGDGNHRLYVWDRQGSSKPQPLHTGHMDHPTDLVFDVLTNRLVWNDNDGFVGQILTDGTNEKFQNTLPDGHDRYGVAVYKDFIISTAASHDHQLTVVYEHGEPVVWTLSLISGHVISILDLHVFDTSLQPVALGRCEENNGGCKQICLPEGATRCACHLGYRLNDDEKSCTSDYTGSKDSNVIILDSENSFYQLDYKKPQIVFHVPVSLHNAPADFTFDSLRNELIWLDSESKSIKKLSSDGLAITVGPRFSDDSNIAVDISGGNIYVSDGPDIKVVSPNEAVKTIVTTSVEGIVGIALLPVKGKMAWIERGPAAIVLANMDGGSQREVTGDMTNPTDLVFDTESADNLYWCDPDRDTIERVNVDALESQPLLSNRLLYPTALDISKELIFFIPRNQRKIYRIDKNDGGGLTAIVESVVMGTFSRLYVAKPTPTGHGRCSNCNGECSTICLPAGEGRRCACADNDNMVDDKTCSTAEICPDLTSDQFSDPENCCLNLPDAICRPVCTSGYSQKVDVIACQDGAWNFIENHICEEIDASDKGFPILYVAIGAGILLLTVVIVTAVICVRRRKGGSKPTAGLQTSQDNVTPGRDYATLGAASPDPPTQLTDAEAADGGVYSYLDENEMEKLHVDLPPEAKFRRKNSTELERSDRYSNFPHLDYKGTGNRSANPAAKDYLTVVDNDRQTFNGPRRPNVEYPPPDEGADGYLTSSSIGGSSRFEGPWQGSGWTDRYPSTPSGGGNYNAYRMKEMSSGRLSNGGNSIWRTQEPGPHFGGFRTSRDSRPNGNDGYLDFSSQL